MAEENELKAVDTGMDFHPDRNDWEQELRRKKWVGIKQKIRRFIHKVTDWNDDIEPGIISWFVLFVAWDIAMAVIHLMVITGIFYIYDLEKLTFDMSGIAFLMNADSFLIGVVFPVYLLCFIIMKGAEMERYAWLNQLIEKHWKE